MFLAVGEELSSPTFMFFFLRSVLRIASCVGPNFITLLTFSPVYHFCHKDINIRLISTQYYNLKHQDDRATESEYLP